MVAIHTTIRGSKGLKIPDDAHACAARDRLRR
jgi:hypothetical protein